ncbi:MAG: hypothetical protein MZV70_67530 [Desulfobacterales bacterium]|nr:hypothetical protein [Desulfobacterales bacterium]
MLRCRTPSNFAGNCEQEERKRKMSLRDRADRIAQRDGRLPAADLPSPTISLNCLPRCDNGRRQAADHADVKVIRWNNRRFYGQGEEVAAVAEAFVQGRQGRVMMIEGRMLKPEDRIYDLVDLLGDSASGFRG